ncbi:telomere zinc finger-associated protein [Spea bombifrons]|uniref:telomere zinc finger-associated protein n=1 Tax=Spea bombifrons TaxID=233779 RepID=UPI00234BFEA1|nr:telomere zinc finger-associated protein [Spea bombifrons]
MSVQIMDSVFIQHSVKVLQALNKQREEGRYCDATLVVGDVNFKAHWSILACGSPFFQSLYGDGTSTNIILHESFSEVIGLVLDFLYTGELALSQHNVQKVLFASKELGVFEAVEVCERFQPKCFDSGDPSERYLQPSGANESLNGHLKQAEESEGEEALKGISELSSVPAVDAPSGEDLGRDRSLCLLQGAEENLSSQTTIIKNLDYTEDGHEREFKRQRRGQKSEHSLGCDGDYITWELEVDHIHDVIAEEDGYIDGDLDEDYVPEKRAQNPKRRLCPAKKSGLSEITTEDKMLDGENLKNRRNAAMPAECPTCHKTFLSKYYLKVHNRKHTGEKPFECSKCGKSYFRKENLMEHEARNCMNRTEQAFSCTLCHEVFKRRMELRVHMVSHTGDMPYKCNTCTQQFMQKKHLQSHMIKLHGAPKPHACSTCGKCFFTRTELRLHEAFKHRGEKLFVCEECGHRASSRSGLQMHIKAKHRNERPYVCEFCHHAFTQKTNLNMHLKTHTGEKPFQCHLCGKTFRTQASLHKHNRTHTGERPFSCEFCDQKFTDKTPLLRHVASRHQEGRPHFCQICGKTFKAIEQLRVHVARHKGVRKFECTECGYKFTRQAHLRRHMEIHNRIENYNPRQRKLRNLIVEDEKTAVVGLQNPGDIVDLQSPSVVVGLQNPPAVVTLPNPSVVVGLQSPHELEVGHGEVIVESINSNALPEEVTEQRICTGDAFSPDVIEQSIFITATTIPDEDCET